MIHSTRARTIFLRQGSESPLWKAGWDTKETDEMSTKEGADERRTLALALTRIIGGCAASCKSIKHVLRKRCPSASLPSVLEQKVGALGESQERHYKS
jgi:hypothetical protein